MDRREQERYSQHRKADRGAGPLIPSASLLSVATVRAGHMFYCSLP